MSNVLKVNEIQDGDKTILDTSFNIDLLKDTSDYIDLLKEENDNDDDPKENDFS